MPMNTQHLQANVEAIERLTAALTSVIGSRVVGNTYELPNMTKAINALAGVIIAEATATPTSES